MGLLTENATLRHDLPLGPLPERIRFDDAMILRTFSREDSAVARDSAPLLPPNVRRKNRQEILKRLRFKPVWEYVDALSGEAILLCP